MKNKINHVKKYFSQVETIARIINNLVEDKIFNSMILIDNKAEIISKYNNSMFIYTRFYIINFSVICGI